jgi:hypothetical protein
MFVLIDKKEKEVYLSNSKKRISEESGLNYHTLVYYLRNTDFYENMKIIFCKTEILPSKQGGMRHKFNNE